MYCLERRQKFLQANNINFWIAKNAEFRNLTATAKDFQKAVQTEYALTIDQHFILQSKTQHVSISVTIIGYLLLNCTYKQL
jgi:hypothetical protein